MTGFIRVFANNYVSATGYQVGPCLSTTGHAPTIASNTFFACGSIASSGEHTSISGNIIDGSYATAAVLRRYQGHRALSAHGR